MNKTKLKSYAPQARKDFIAAVTARAHLLGISSKAGKLSVAASQPHGDTTVIAGQAWPVLVHSQRQQLIARIEKQGFDQTMEAVAYTWFNRFAALRYMELHDYLGHGYRALSGINGTLPDILTHATDLMQNSSLPGLKPAAVIDMKLAGNRDGELYRMLLVAQCNALSNTMPFLFERIDDETELLLPDNLLRTDSVVAKLVATIDEEDWKQVEIIGWLYQYYISEKKGEVIGKVVNSQDIPAATQLFTPNWIVQYMVQNSVGRLWLMANPDSTLKAQWPYYIEPANQSPEVQAQLNILIQTRMDEDDGSLHPESITLLDPACGSGHILVEAYDVLKAIYLERGYQPRTIPRLILEKNLFGLDIDDRAAQMAGFALVMKARSDDRRLFDAPIKLNVLSLQESNGLDADEVTRALEAILGRAGMQVMATASDFGEDDLFPGLRPQLSLSQYRPTYLTDDKMHQAIAALIEIFAHAKTYGSLIQIPPGLNAELVVIAERLQVALKEGDLYARAAAHDLLPLVEQARLLGLQFDAVVANPPYMGAKGMNLALNSFAKNNFPDSKSDLFAMFIERGFNFCRIAGFNSMVTMHSWMFLSSYETMRVKMLNESLLTSLLQLPYDGKGPTAMGINFGLSAFVFQKAVVLNHRSSFDCFRYYELTEDGLPGRYPSGNERNITAIPSCFRNIPGSPVAYWLPQSAMNVFPRSQPLEKIAEPRQGMATSDVNRFIRYWFEISFAKIGFDCESNEQAAASGMKWFPHNKGGEYRRWYGNNLSVVNWESGGSEILFYAAKLYGSPTRTIKNISYYFKPSVSWSLIGSGVFSARVNESGFTFDVAGPSAFPRAEDIDTVAGFLNSRVAFYFIKAFNPTMNFNSGDIARLPFLHPNSDGSPVRKLVRLAKSDWDASEISWDFSQLEICNKRMKSRISESWIELAEKSRLRIAQAKLWEEENNQLFINTYGLQDELSAEVPESQITLARADREKDCQRLISYAIGCMMGRYSLNEPGLIYANSQNIGFDAARYSAFPADADGILPITDQLWYDEEAASRVQEFLRAVWSADTLDENMSWLAENLGAKTGETPEETIRRYLAEKFYKDHLQTYKKRPIYWLFSSGKQGAFQALVYLHRYNEGTLGRMRAEYVVPLTGKIQSRIDTLEKDAIAAASTAARNKLTKEVEKLKKKHIELLAYDEQLRHYADMRITLDLDDGVKVNYGKFGDLLAEVKAVTGGASDD